MDSPAPASSTGRDPTQLSHKACASSHWIPEPTAPRCTKKRKRREATEVSSIKFRKAMTKSMGRIANTMDKFVLESMERRLFQLKVRMDRFRDNRDIHSDDEEDSNFVAPQRLRLMRASAAKLKEEINAKAEEIRHR
eukprot:scaffold2983_cov123-Cylindrotheca_fusiformis.AAC.8